MANTIFKINKYIPQIDKSAPMGACEKSILIKGAPEAVETAKRLIKGKIGGGGGGGRGRTRGGKAGRWGGGQGESQGGEEADAILARVGLKDVDAERARLDQDLEDYKKKKH